MFIMLPEYDSAGLKNAVDVNNLFVTKFILLCILFYLISCGPGGSVSIVTELWAGRSGIESW